MMLARVSHDKTIRIANWLIDGKSSLAPSEADELALHALSLAAECSNPAALNNLGWMHLNARGCDKDAATARECFERAAAAGSTMALYHMGRLYEEGLGVPVDTARALELYKQAAERGNEQASERICTLENGNNE